MRVTVAILAALFACKTEAPPPQGPKQPPPVEVQKERGTTPGHIAVENLEHQISQAGMRMKMAPGDWRRRAALVELYLMKAQLLGQYASLDEAVALAEREEAAETADGLMVRARVRAALHRFRDAEVDLQAAEKLGADARRLDAARTSIQVASGHPEAAIPAREADATKHPSYGALTGLAAALDAAGRFQEAEKAYVAALEAYRSTSPFAVAWVHFARGKMWAERAGDEARGRRFYALALSHLPQYVVANVHLAEIESEANETEKAIARLEKVVKTADDPEPFGLLGELYVAAGRKEEGRAMIAEAKARYDELLAKYPLAFADHGAEFFLGPGEDPTRAYALAKQNLENRETPRSLALAIRAARAARQAAEACVLIRRARSKPRNGVELDGLRSPDQCSK